MKRPAPSVMEENMSQRKRVSSAAFAFTTVFAGLFLCAAGREAYAGAAAMQKKKQQQIIMQKKIAAQRARTQEARPPAGGVPAVSEEELGRIWNALKTAGHVWQYIEDENVKRYIVEQYIQLHRRRGIKIEKSAVHYAAMIDAMAADSPKMLRLPFIKLIQIVAAMEYDYDFGQDLDAYARDILGEEAHRDNRKRLKLDALEK